MPHWGECHPLALKVHPKHQTWEACRTTHNPSVKGSTYERVGVMIRRDAEDAAWHRRAMPKQPAGGKNSSHCGISFSQAPSGNSRRVGAQEVGELQTQKMVVIAVCNPNRLRLYDARRGLQAVHGPEWSTRNFQGDWRRFRQRMPNNHHCTGRRDVDCGGKFQGFLADSVTCADKNRNGDMQPHPLPLFLLG